MKAKTGMIGRILAVAFVLASLGMIFLNWISSYMTYWDVLKPTLDNLEYAGESTELVILLIVTAVLLVTGIIAVICACTGSKWGVFPHIFGALAAFGFFVYAINEMGGGFGDMGIGAWLCLGLAVAAFLSMLIPDTSGGRTAYAGGAYAGGRAVSAGMPTRSAASTWTCPKCGTILADRERFCPNCGGARVVTPPPAPAPAPAQLRCANCGTVLAKKAAFCPNCGTPAPAAPVAKPAAPAGWTCPGCGTKLDAKQKFCPNCGTKKPETAAPAPAPAPAAPAGWTCPGCGTKLDAKQKFCPNCGTRKPEPAAPAPATPTYTAPATPTYTAPAAPAYTAPATPTYTAPAAPTYAAPATPAYTAPAAPTYAPKHENPAPSGGFYNPGDDDL